MEKLKVNLYTRPDCLLCKEAELEINNIQASNPIELNIINIDSDLVLQEKFGISIPVVEAGPYRLEAPFTNEELKITIAAALDRQNQLQKINGLSSSNPAFIKASISRGDKIAIWISKHYLALINLFLLLYCAIPFLAPVLKKSNLNLPAEIIYKLYSPVCHQWSFRSWFIFGEQSFYPHESAGIEDIDSFEKMTGISDISDPARQQARLFEGNSLMGYKVALCQRDEAIWGSMALFGIIYAISGRRIKKLHWLLWIILGLLPVGLDGFSQLFSQFPMDFIHTFLPYRESTPLIRTITGFFFGWTTAWFTIPLIDETMVTSRKELGKKY